jgi:hypothetical protein
VPSFFVPFARTADVAEETYRSLAEWCGARVPEDPTDRICAITWVSNREEWTATVGDELRGIVRERIRSTGPYRQMYESVKHLRDNATVLAIFEGSRFKIVTNARPMTEVSSAWDNPLLVDATLYVMRFDAPHST